MGWYWLVLFGQTAGRLETLFSAMKTKQNWANPGIHFSRFIGAQLGRMQEVNNKRGVLGLTPWWQWSLQTSKWDLWTAPGQPNFFLFLFLLAPFFTPSLYETVWLLGCFSVMWRPAIAKMFPWNKCCCGSPALYLENIWDCVRCSGPSEGRQTAQVAVRQPRIHRWSQCTWLPSTLQPDCRVTQGWSM